MYKVAVLGDRESVGGFASLGLSVFPAEDAAQASETFARLCGGGFAVVFITEALAEELREEITRRRGERLPAIIEIPGVRGNTGHGMQSVHEAVEKAVGSDILRN